MKKSTIEQITNWFIKNFGRNREIEAWEISVMYAAGQLQPHALLEMLGCDYRTPIKTGGSKDTITSNIIHLKNSIELLKQMYGDDPKITLPVLRTVIQMLDRYSDTYEQWTNVTDFTAYLMIRNSLNDYANGVEAAKNKSNKKS